MEATILDIDKVKYPEVAVVILNWNGLEYLKKFLPSVVAASYPNMKIVLGDNASTDESVDFVKGNYPNIEVLTNEKNEGFAKGYNSILARVSADYFLLLNSDVEVSQNWLQPMVKLMEEDKNIAACQPKMLQYAQPTNFEYAGACGGWIDAAGYPFARGRLFDICETDTGQYDEAGPCFWASGAAMMVRAKCFIEAGGFDEYFFAHQEEIDLCWRLQNLGYSIYVQPAAVVYHVGGGTLPKGNSKKTFLNFRNNLVMLYKNLPPSRLWYILPFRIFLDAIAAWRELLAGRGAQYIAIAKAHFHFFMWVLNKKTRCTENRTPGDLKGYYPGLIIWDHFVKKKNTFSEVVKNQS